VGDAAGRGVGVGAAELSLLTSSWVTVFMTSGPVTNMYEVLSTIAMKSVIAGE
jgi:hypothetical protein